jgi:hypothetical protein
MNRDERLDDPQESLRLALESSQAQIWTATPGVVSGVDLAAQTVSVQPSIQGTVTGSDGSTQNVNLPVLVDVPIVWPKAGGFCLTFPIAVGDEVLVVFGARCIDSWWQSGGVGAPAEARMHDLSDGFAILAPTSQPKKISGVSSTSVQLRDNAGSTFVEITPGGKVRVIGASGIDVEAPTVNITASAEIKMVAPTITMNGQVTQTSGSFMVGGITFGSHKHTGVQPGSGSTGSPTN